MWPFNYGFAVWGTVVLYVAILIGYWVWMRAADSREKKRSA